MNSEHTQVSKQTSKKRKRTKNTTTEQYEMYLSLLEEDYYIRSGTVNPTLGENYHTNKWDELCIKLNAIGNGPSLTVEEWKKRFTDWKYAVRAKYRKLSEHRKRTGSGPESDIKITAIEERALGVWGKVVVTGTPHISDYDGLFNLNADKPATATEINNEGTEEQHNFNISDMSVVILNNNDKIIEEDTSLQEKNIVIVSQSAEVDQNMKKASKIHNIQNNKRKNPARTKPLSFLTEKLLETSTRNEKNSEELNKTFKNFSVEFIKVQNEKNDIDALRLQFEIEKYKFENPSFIFDR